MMTRNDILRRLAILKLLLAECDEKEFFEEHIELSPVNDILLEANPSSPCIYWDSPSGVVTPPDNGIETINSPSVRTTR